MSHRNETFAKFQGPDTLIAEYGHWDVLARPRQATLGAMVLVARGPATAWPDLPPPAFAELARVTADIEAAARSAFGFEKMNYLMLMMVDPHVHFHVLPRYSAPKTHHGRSLEDAGWPGPPDLSAGVSDPAFTASVRDALKAGWPSASGPA